MKLLRKLLQVSRSARWTAISQALSALSNLLLAIVLAKLLDKSSFGSFSIAFITYGIVIAVARAAAGQVLQIRHSGDSAADFRRPLAGALTVGCAVAAAGIVASLVGGVIGPDNLWLAMSALAISLPGLVIQDTCRMAYFARGEAKGAALLDALWSLVLVVAIALLIVSDQATLFKLTLAWGLSGSVAGIVGMVRLRGTLNVAEAVAWFRDKASLIGYLLGEYVIGLGAAQLSILAVGVATSEVEVGSLRGAQVILGPLNVLGTAVFMFGIPELARRPYLTAHRRAQLAMMASGLLGVVTLVYVFVTMLLPDHVGTALFGETWAGAREVLLVMGIASLFSTLAAGPAVVLYGLGRANVTFWLHAVKAPLLLTSMLILSRSSGAEGAALALAGCEAIVLPAWIYAMRRAARKADAETTAEPLNSGVA